MTLHIRPGARGEIDAALRELERTDRERERRIDIFVERLAEIGRQTAAELFQSAQYDGTNDVSVYAEKTENGWRIVASGNAVAFIEFGTGVTMPEYPSDAAVRYAHGTYGQGKGRNPAGWVYAGESGTGGQPLHYRDGREKPGVYRTHGNPPAAAMYAAIKAMRAAAPSLAKEIFAL